MDGSGNAYITGRTFGSLGGSNAGGCDAFVAKYNSGGDLQWAPQIGTSGDDRGYSVAVDSSGSPTICGITAGTLGEANMGYEDAFLVKYSSFGLIRSTIQIGTGTTDVFFSVAVDESDNAYLCGFTTGSLGGTTAGWIDAFLVKFKAALYGDANLDGMVNVVDMGIVAINYGMDNATWQMGDFDGDGIVAVKGDADHNGVVDVVDLGILATYYGKASGATWYQGDFNRDGKVNVIDLGILATHYGEDINDYMNPPSSGYSSQQR